MDKTIQITDFSDTISTKVKSQGRISGLTKYVGRKCLVIIEKEEGSERRG